MFNWFVNITSITGLITWDLILITYVRFYAGLKHHGIDRNTLPYKAPLQPYASYFGIFFITIIIIFNGFQVFLAGEWDVNVFITAYICLPIFLVFYLIWKIGKRSKFVRVQDMDFHTGRRELEESKYRGAIMSIRAILIFICSASRGVRQIRETHDYRWQDLGLAQ